MVSGVHYTDVLWIKSTITWLTLICVIVDLVLVLQTFASARSAVEVSQGWGETDGFRRLSVVHEEIGGIERCWGIRWAARFY